MKIIARIKTDFPSKFGIPRQSGIIDDLKGQIIFEPEFRNADTLRGLEEYSYIWLIWEFDQNIREQWKPTVRPPKLGGNTRKGVFATRSPFRPNPIGISSVKLEKIQYNSNHGPILHVSGIDLMNNTPIYDIKPYLPLIDCHPKATGGFTELIKYQPLQVSIDSNISENIPKNYLNTLIKVLEQDPRPSYQDDPNRIYGLTFGNYNIRFTVDNNLLTIKEIKKL